MIHSLAGELGLDVYVVSLSRSGLDDTALSEMISELPARCIALMEDIDAAFHKGIENRDEADAAPPPPPLNGEGQSQPPPQSAGALRSSASRITLSGLLNAIDGIGAHDGRLLYATTNKYSALDPALCRPGRMDLHIEFKLASRYQAQELFKCFYLPGDDGGEVEDEEDEVGLTEKANVVDSGYSSLGTTTPEHDLASGSPTDEKAEFPIPIPAPESPSLPTTKPSKTTIISPPPIYVGNSHRTRAPLLTRHQVADLAGKFACSLPEEREFSMAALQGYLMTYKTRPFEAVQEVSKWIDKDRLERAEKSKALGTRGK
jgi:chaperone BCS1